MRNVDLSLSIEEAKFILASLERVNYSGSKTGALLAGIVRKIAEEVKNVEEPQHED